MSQNVNLAYPFAIIVVSDRRLSAMGKGGTLTERSTKLTGFACADAKGTIGYNGIGWDDDSKTPSEWVQDLDHRTPFSTLSLHQVLELLRSDAEIRISRLSSAYPDRRHTYVIAVWHERQTLIYTISNYERASNEARDAKARPQFDIDLIVPSSGKNILVVATGATRTIKPNHLKRVEDAIKANKSTREIKNLCAKIVKDVSYTQGRRGSVGTSVQWVVMGESNQDLWYGLDLPGGTTVVEPPNLIGLSASTDMGGGWSVKVGGEGMSVRETYLEVSTGTGEWGRYDPISKGLRIDETPCGMCGAKVPEGYRRCPVCDAKIIN
jgi:hypothetical protein